MKFALITTAMCIIISVLMLYDRYLKTVHKDHLQDQLDLVDEQIEKCDNHYRLKKLISLRKKIKKKIDNM